MNGCARLDWPAGRESGDGLFPDTAQIPATTFRSARGSRAWQGPVFSLGAHLLLLLLLVWWPARAPVPAHSGGQAVIVHLVATVPGGTADAGVHREQPAVNAVSAASSPVLPSDSPVVTAHSPTVSPASLIHLAAARKKRRAERPRQTRPGPEPDPRPMPAGKPATPDPGSRPGAREHGGAVANDRTVAMPRPGGNPPPEYPRLARRRGWQGTVLLGVVVDEKGRPLEVMIKKSSGYPLLDRAARKTVCGWSFIPASRGRRPVRARIIVPIRFVLTR